MSEILFLAHRLPFPPDRGDKIRSFHVLHALARLAPVHVGTFAESAADLAHEPELAALAASHCLHRRARALALSGAEAMLRGEPVSLAAFRDAALARWVGRTLAERPVSTVYLFSGQMGQYVPAGWRGRVVADMVDVDSAKFEAYAQDAAWPLSWLHAREARLLAAEEARIAGRADATLLVSKPEAALLRSRVAAPARIEAMPNGIDAGHFDPATVAPHPALAEAGPHLVFTGQLDYPPNIAAAQRLLDRVLPAVRAVHPDATAHIVGRAPVPSLKARDGEPGVRVWGEVPDVRPFLAGASLVVAPLAIARGVQNKVLEAMAMARPVVLTPEAATGIDALDGEHFAIAGGDAELAARALSLLADPPAAEAMGAAARQFVLGRMGWDASLSRLPEFVAVDGGLRRDAA